MALPVNKKKTQLLLLSFSCTLIIFFINKNSNISSYSLPKMAFNLRNLIESEEKFDKRCENTNKEFLEQYNKSIDFYDKNLNDDNKDDKYLEVLKDIIREKNLGKIKKYLPRIIMYAIFVIVDILLIFLWIALCGCCCCGKKKKESATGCSKCYFFLFCFLNVIAIIICICGFILVPYFLKSINGVICSLYKLVLHFTDGIKNDYDYLDINWKGFGGIKNCTEQYYDAIGDIKDIKDTENLGTECNNYNQFCVYYFNTLNLIDENNLDFIQELERSEKNINEMSNPFINIKNNTLDDIEKLMEVVDKKGKSGLFLLFCAIALLCLIGLLTLSFYFICNCNCIICLFHLFWNIEMIIIIVTILVGVCFGIFGVLSKDLAQILKYVKSKKNLNSGDPLLLKVNNDSYYNNLTNLCLNDDGNLTSYVFDTNKKYISKIDEEFYKEFQNKYDELKKSGIDQSSKLVKAYENLEDIIKNLKNINNDLREGNINKIFNCSFFKRDFDILLNELKDKLAKKLCLFSLGIIIADLVSFLAIFFGVLIASNYTGKNVGDPEDKERHIKMKVKDNRPNLDSSSDNFRK